MNGAGLGHITRVLAIARQVRRLAPESEILVLSSSEHSGILWREGIASVKVPSFQSWEADHRLPVPELTNALTAQTVAIFRPHVVVVEAHSAGTFSELISPVLNISKRIFVFGMFPQFYGVPEYKLGLQCYQRILMPYKEEEKDEIGVSVGDRADWVGDILVRSPDEILPREAARRRIGLGMDDLVFYVSLGGGGHPQNDEALKWVLEVLSDYPSIRVACAMQPLSKRHDLLFQREQVISVSHYPMVEYFAAFDAAIASAGGHVAEFIHTGTPVILIPFDHPAVDQELHVKRFVTKGLGLKVKLFDIGALAAAIEELLDSGRRAEMAGRMRAWAGPNGAEVAARAILEYVTSGPGHASVL